MYEFCAGGSGRGEEPSGAKGLRRIQIRLSDVEFGRTAVGSSRTNGKRRLTDVDRVADSSSTNAVNFSSALTTNRFRSPRCTSAINIVRLSESTAEMQSQLQTDFACDSRLWCGWQSDQDARARGAISRSGELTFLAGPDSFCPQQYRGVKIESFRFWKAE